MLDNEEVKSLKIKVLSLELELKRKDTDITDLNSELVLVKADMDELRGTFHSVSKELADKNVALEVSLGHANSLEETVLKLQKKLKVFNASIDKLRHRHSSHSEGKVTELLRQLKERERVIEDCKKKNNLLSERLSELEEKFKSDSLNMDCKYKKSSDSLTAKTGELKEVKKKLNNAEKRTAELLETIDSKNKKITELDNENTRLKLIKSNNASVSKAPEADRNSPLKADTRIKCRYENTGNCKTKHCKNFHPKKTCQGYSKLGSCAFESICEHRHPYGVCHSWKRDGSCNEGDECRHRHPFYMSSEILRSSQDHFLAEGQRRISRSPDRRNRRAQGHRHSRRRSR